MASIYGGGEASVYGNIPPAAPAPIAPTSAASGGSRKVIADFDPENNDEIELRVGDIVQVTKEYDDGWGTGTNTVTNQKGLFPLDCIEGFSDGNPQQVDANGKKKYKQRMSSIYDADMNANYTVYDDKAPPPAAQNNKTGDLHTVSYDFDPENGDEIELRVGDQIKLIKQYDDGWGVGLNIVTNKEGLFPLDCLPGFGEAVKDETGKKKNKARLSSIYGANSVYDTDSVYYGNGTESVYDNGAAGAITAIYDFQAGMTDEIDIAVGDQILVSQQFDDGWGTGKNLSTNKTGLFPLDCLPGSGGNPQNNKKNRVSSLYAGNESVYDSNSVYYNNNGRY